MIETRRRSILFIATSSLVAVGGGAALWPLIDSLNPSTGVRVPWFDIDLGQIGVGQRTVVNWDGKPIFVSHRNNEEIAAARADDLEKQLRMPAADAQRTKKPEWLVFIGLCTKLSVVLSGQRGDYRGDYNGWFCPVCASHFDTSGRVRKGPAPRNLTVPDYFFVDDRTIRLQDETFSSRI